MKSLKVFLVTSFALVVFGAGHLFAEDVSVVIRKQIAQIAQLGANPQATEADKLKMQELYQVVQAQGPNAVPVIEEFLKSKDNAAEKQACLYLAGVIVAPRTIEETETKGKQLTELIKIGLADESDLVKGYALQMIGSMAGGTWWRGDSLTILIDFFEKEKNTRFRIYALSRIAGFMTDSAYATITSALNDSDPAVKEAAVSYKAYQDELRAKKAE